MKKYWVSERDMYMDANTMPPDSMRVYPCSEVDARIAELKSILRAIYLQETKLDGAQFSDEFLATIAEALGD